VAVDGDIPSAADIAEPIQKIGAERGTVVLEKLRNTDRIHLGWRLQQQSPHLGLPVAAPVVATIGENQNDAPLIVRPALESEFTTDANGSAGCRGACCVARAPVREAD